MSLFLILSVWSPHRSSSEYHNVIAYPTTNRHSSSSTSLIFCTFLAAMISFLAENYIPGNGDTWDRIFRFLLLIFIIMWTFWWNTPLRWHLGWHNPHWKKKNNWLTHCCDGSGSICYCPKLPHIGATWDSVLMTYNLIWKWNLLILNFTTGQSDMLVCLFSNDRIYFWASWQRLTWNYKFVPSYPTKCIFCL